MKDHFLRIADAVCRLPPAAPGAGPGAAGGGTSGGAAVERVTLYLASEQSDFVRFNRSAVRQMTSVEQHKATVAVIAGQRRAAASTTLSGDAKADVARLLEIRDALAHDLPMVPQDPHLRMPHEIVHSDRDDGNASALPSVDEIVTQVLEQSRGLDLVGFHAAGPVIAAFADSRGQRNWHRIRNFHLDWSLFCSGDPAVRDRAVKSIYAGETWDAAEFARRMALAKARLALLERPARTIAPGAYRAWLEPMAVAEMLGTLAWGGFGIKQRRTGTGSLGALASAAATLSPGFELREATAEGIAPAFTSTGHVRPPAVPLVSEGRCAQALVSPRSAAEFGLPANADDDEYPASLSLAGGALPAEDALAALDTGLWIGNLWYLGYSDRQACRMTGMTRFACFLVERGEIAAPIGVMRFDDSFLRLFGESLVGLSREVQLLPSNDTYGERHLGSVSSPGALLADMRFTL
jgi:predicted Zn-dependent protease